MKNNTEDILGFYSNLSLIIKLQSIPHSYASNDPEP